MTVGHRAGTSYMLEAGEEAQIGRGTECKVMLSDPLCSRVHAIVWKKDGMWRVRDADSRNGTFVNGQKVDDAAIADGHYIRVGSTEFSFHESDERPTLGP